MKLTLRQSMIIVAAMALFMWAFFRLGTDSEISLAIGRASVPLVFVVTDAVSKRPIENASIHLYIPDELERRDPPYVLDLKTGPDGRATILVELGNREAVELSSNRLLSYHVAYPEWEMKFTAGGYRSALVSFMDNQAKDPRFHLPENNPPPIVVQLQRLPAPVDSKIGQNR